MRYLKISAKEAIAIIQKDAFEAIGMNFKDIQTFFKSEKQRVANYIQDKPNYLRSREEILLEDNSLTYVELDLVKRFDIPVPTVYQHPYLFSWLKDSWRYHAESLYGRKEIREKHTILATAPTGKFNAMALSGEIEDGILLEDGLINVMTGVSNLVSFLLFERLSNRQYSERNLEELKHYSVNNYSVLEKIAVIIYDYLIEGYSSQPPPLSDDYREDFSIRHVLSNSCLSFIFEHELFHLREAEQENLPINREILEKRYQEIWKFFTKKLSNHLPVTISEQQFRLLYFQHQEELFADYFAFEAILKLGIKDKTLVASIQGAFLFFIIAELIEFLLKMLTDKGAMPNLYQSDGLTVALTAIIMEESHPYAFARREGLISGLSSNKPQYANLVKSQAEKISFIIKEVRKLLKQKVNAVQVLPKPHPKWQFGNRMNYKSLFQTKK